LILLIGVLDANVVVGLAKGDVFHLLRSLYSPLYVTPEVKAEVIGAGSGRAGASELLSALGVWVTEIVPDPQILQQVSPSLSAADREVLAIAQDPSLRVDHILSGDDHVVRQAHVLGLPCLRTTDLVLVMKVEGLIAQVKPVLDLMRQHGFGIDDALYARVLRAAGE
jgi:predicted nucleic acid-binding protein